VQQGRGSCGGHFPSRPSPPIIRGKENRANQTPASAAAVKRGRILPSFLPCFSCLAVLSYSGRQLADAAQCPAPTTSKLSEQKDCTYRRVGCAGAGNRIQDFFSFITITAKISFYPLSVRVLVCDALQRVILHRSSCV
jgi:hypothetical protein